MDLSLTERKMIQHVYIWKASYEIETEEILKRINWQPRPKKPFKKKCKFSYWDRRNPAKRNELMCVKEVGKISIYKGHLQARYIYIHK
jgi:hypothetical protein